MSDTRHSRPPRIASPIPASVPRDRLLDAMRKRDPFLAGCLVAGTARSTVAKRRGRTVIVVELAFDVETYVARAATKATPMQRGG